MRILLIEDNPGDVRLITEYLKEGSSEKFELTEATALESSLSCLKNGSHDVVLLDLGLPDSRGIDTFFCVQNHSPDLPIVVLTGLDDEIIAKKAIRGGAQDYLVKSHLNGNLLWRVIRYAIERHNLRKALHRNRELISKFMDSATETFWLWDSAMNLVEINASGLKTFFPDSQKQDIVGQGFSELGMDTHDKIYTKKMKDVLETGVSLSLDDYDVSSAPDNSIFSLNAFKCGELLGMILTDISERKRHEQELIQTEKMTAIGTMAAGIAHELNNPMMAILHFAQYCMKNTKNNDKCYPVLADIHKETKRCIEIVQNLLTFSRTENERNDSWHKEDLSAVFDRVFNLLSYRTEKENVRVIRNYPEKQVKVQILMKGNLLQQAFFNIIVNAIDAVKMSKKKEICVNIERKDKFVHVAISDTGCGITPKDMKRIFDPFFTTKPVGQGTGLGLSLSKSIIKSHNGCFLCKSQPQKGTEFIATFPVE